MSTETKPQPSLKFEDFAAVQEYIKLYEKDNATKFVLATRNKVVGRLDWKEWLKAKKRQVRWESALMETKTSPVIEFSGSPFMYMGNIIYSCHHGVDHSKKQKERYKKERDRKMMYDNVFIKKRTLIKPTKKMGCKATIYVTQIVCFPDVKIEKNVRKDRSSAAGNLQKMIQDNLENLQVLVEYHVRFPHPEDHICGATSNIPRYSRESQGKACTKNHISPLDEVWLPQGNTQNSHQGNSEDGQNSTEMGDESSSDNDSDNEKQNVVNDHDYVEKICNLPSRKESLLIKNRKRCLALLKNLVDYVHLLDNPDELSDLADELTSLHSHVIRQRPRNHQLLANKDSPIKKPTKQKSSDTSSYASLPKHQKLCNSFTKRCGQKADVMKRSNNVNLSTTEKLKSKTSPKLQPSTSSHMITLSTVNDNRPRIIIIQKAP